MIVTDRKDLFWSYAATILKIGASALLLPIILRIMPPEMVGIWSVFTTITAFASLLDFGFSPSFTRNVTYVFSGVTNLKINGIESVPYEEQAIDYGLLKGVIAAMRWIYLRMAVILLLLLATIGTFYIYSILKNYEGNHQEVYIAWLLLCLITTYNLFTLYYESLLLGKGLIKKSKQIVIIGQTIYLVIAAILIISGYGLIAIVSAQAISVIIIRLLSYRSFFSRHMKEKLKTAIPRPKKEILHALFPNALKVGLTSFGGFLVQKSALVIGSLFLTLEEIAKYGISVQFISIITGLAGIYITTYHPKISQLRVEQNIDAIKAIYLKGQLVLLLTYFAGGLGLLYGGEQALLLIGSQTHLMPTTLLLVTLVVAFLECNHSIAAAILVTKNEVPFFKASLISGGAIVTLLFLFFKYSEMGLWAMIIAPGIVQLIYQNWKWPKEVIDDLKIRKVDVIAVFKTIKLLS